MSWESRITTQCRQCDITQQQVPKGEEQPRGPRRSLSRWGVVLGLSCTDFPSELLFVLMISAVSQRAGCSKLAVPLR